MQLHSALHTRVCGTCRRPSRARRLPLRVSAKATADEKAKIGFRWDGANLRWVRDDRYADLAADEDNTLIRPKSGSAYVVWPVVHTVLTEAKLRSVPASEAAEMQSQGWTLLDVRLETEYEQQHAAGAVNAPFYRYVQGDSSWDNLKRLAMGAFAMKATERNPAFVDAALSKLQRDQKVIVYCAIGGTLDTNVSYRRDKKLYADPERAFGRESRSLKAVYELLQAGWSPSNILHLEGGIQQWRYQGFDLEGGLS